MEWNDLPQVKKGNLGEEIVDRLLERKGYVPYHPVFDGPHPFDRICASADKKKLIIVEVKTKPARGSYPDTGINVSVYNVYKEIERTHNIRLYLAFVDEIKKQIYGGWLQNLDKTTSVEIGGKYRVYPVIEKTIIFFPLVLMTKISDLTLEQAKKLRSLSNRTYIYKDA